MQGAARVVELDSLRALAALGVLATHLNRSFGFGHTGVELFFVLSGYLITSIVVTNRRQPGFLRVFYARRCLRIWPIYYLALGTLVGLNLLRKHPEPMGGMAYYFTYLQYTWEYWQGTKPPTALPLYHTWTLAAEEQFYLAWPVLLLVVGVRYLKPLAVILTVMPLLVRHFWGAFDTLLGHCDGLAVGALLSTLISAVPTKATRAQRLLLPAVGLLALAGYFVNAWYIGRGLGAVQAARSNVGISLISLSYFGLIGLVVVLAGSRLLCWLRLPGLCYLGRISYGLYLYHLLIFEWIDAKLKFQMGYADTWRLDALKVGVTVAVAALSWHLIEQPILKLKERFQYRRPPLGQNGTGLEA
jgi:peptidoglycan/LPS O-acetylase OafA/YrhL